MERNILCLILLLFMVLTSLSPVLTVFRPEFPIVLLLTWPALSYIAIKKRHKFGPIPIILIVASFVTYILANHYRESLFNLKSVKQLERKAIVRQIKRKGWQDTVFFHRSLINVSNENMVIVSSITGNRIEVRFDMLENSYILEPIKTGIIYSENPKTITDLESLTRSRNNVLDDKVYIVRRLDPNWYECSFDTTKLHQ